MENKIKKYLKILAIELEDLIIDLEFSEKVVEKRFKEHKITEYVFHENMGLVKKEILGVEKVKKLINNNSEKVVSIERLREMVEDHFKEEIEAIGLPNVVFLLVSRKLDKIDKYMDLEG